MNILLWILQIFLGLYFIFIGIMHFILPPGLPTPMSWMYDLPAWLHWVSGLAEILGGLGLILPAVFRIQTRLVVWAALGLALTMLIASIYHIPRGEYLNMGMTLLNMILLLFIAFGRTRLVPLKDRGT
jgi:putative oxidoreductase